MTAIRKRRAAVVTAVATALLTTTIGAGAAFGLPGSTVDPSIPGTLIIHKYESPSTGEATGDVLDPEPSNETLANVKFKITLVNPEGKTAAADDDLDLTTNAGWVNVAKLLSGSQVDAISSIISDGLLIEAGATSGFTDAEGVLTFGNMPLGLYLVQEVGAYTDATHTTLRTDVTPAAPFLVTMPMTKPGTTAEWMTTEDGTSYVVNVYPKNSITGAEKEVADGATNNQGDVFTWTVTGDIPQMTAKNGDDSITSVEQLPLNAGYWMHDDLDPRLTYQGSKVYLKTMAGGLEELTLGTDYNLFAGGKDSTTPATDVVDEDGPDLWVKFTDAGLLKLAMTGGTSNVDTLAQVVWTIDTKANAEGEIPNQAELYPNNGDGDFDYDGVPTDTIESRWGQIEIDKFDSTSSTDGTFGNASNVLVGATFELFAVTGPAADALKTFTDAKFAEDLSVGVEKMVINGVPSWTTGDDGKATISSLRYSDFANGEEISATSDLYVTYFLVETKAPSGYELLAAPIQVDLLNKSTTRTTDDLTTEDINESVALSIQEVANVPHNGGFNLPKTGGTGTTLVYIAGGLVLASGAVLLVLRRRKSEA